MKKGYSLIELTIVVGLISILSITISAIVLTTIINSNRIKTKVRVRQSGDYAIGQIQTMVHNSRAITACNSIAEQVTLRNQDNRTTLIYLDVDRIASNSGTFLTPDDTTITNYNLTCLPTDTEPKLIQFSFTIGRENPTLVRTTENPMIDYTFAAEVKNE